MTENSFFFPGTTIGDAGPYAASTTWKTFAQIARVGNAESLVAFYDMGVFYAVANKLEPTINGANIDVDTGASLVDGGYHENDAIVSIPIPAATIGGETRIDLIVVRKNFQTGITYTPTLAGPTVGPQEIRITVINGTQAVAPVAPTVTQDTTRTTYWDIPLATVIVNNAGALSSLVDLREYVDAETKYLWTPALGGYNETDGNGIIAGDDALDERYIVSLPDNKEARAVGSFIVPQDFISDMSVFAVVVPAGTGNVELLESDTRVRYGACGENFANHSVDLGVGVSIIAVTQFERECIAELSMSNASAGDMATVQIYRNGNSVNDTIGGTIGVNGWRIEYFGWKK